MALNPNAMAVLERRYIRKDETGAAIETVDGMFHRVAYHVAMAHTDPGADHDALTGVYETMMSNLEFLPNTPTFTGAGTPLGQLAACFVLPIDDDIGKDSKAGIFSTLRNAALIQQSGGGVGFSFSRLRHKGDRVQKSAGIASGPVSFIKVFDVAMASVSQVEPSSTYKVGEMVMGAAPVDFQVAKGPIEFMSVYNCAFSAIAQGGTRRGASMGVLRVDHPDIFDFISCKSDQTLLNGFNISVGITDKFMRCVSDGLDFDLIGPRNGQVVRTVPARSIMAEIVKNAYHNGEPGVLFLDAMNARNPLPHLYSIETTNPCVTADTIITTSCGQKPVRELIGLTFQTHEGSICLGGFFCKGQENIYSVRTRHGYSLRCTNNHRLMNATGRWVHLHDLSVGDKVLIHNFGPDTIVAISDTGCFENVYDCTVRSNYHCYVSNGFYSHNCGEQALGPWENCCLGSINLAKHLTWVSGERIAVINWDKLATTIRNSVRFLDDVITANRYIPAIPDLREAAWKSRRIGLGYMGLADLLMAVGIRYGSIHGRLMTEHITAFMQMHAMMASIDLAKERGPFPAIEGSIYDPKNIKWTPPHYPDFDCEWAAIISGIKKYGIRNAALTTIAPTGTIGTVAGVEGYGIEPVFALSYTRRVNQSDGTPLFLKYASPLFARACSLDGIEESNPAYQEVLNRGSCQGVDGIPYWIQNVFVTSGDLGWKEHVDMQCAAQKFLSNSVSKTINFPRTATETDVQMAYEYAWGEGCCGITVYVDGSRDGAVLVSGK